MSSPPAPTRTLVRSVRGRPASPYRGQVLDGDGDPRAPREPSSPRSRAEIIAALRKLEGITLAEEGATLTLRRAADETLALGLGAGPTSALADLSFTGNEYIAMLALDELVELFGPLELDISGYTDLVDGTEPGAATRRYQEHMRGKVEQLMSAASAMNDMLGMLRTAVENAEVRRNSPETRRAHRRELIAILGLVLAGLGVWIYFARFAGHAVGGPCTTDNDCRSKQCLPHETVEPMRIGSSELAPRPVGPGGPGVCTESCTTDADCPSAMRCRPAMSWSEFSAFGSRVDLCAPAAWDGER